MNDLQLHSYQIVARDFLRGRDKAALFLDMGLGKTAVTLSALEPRHLPVLVVAPKRVAENVWEAEGALWRPELRMGVAMGSPVQRAKVLEDETLDVVVLGRDNLRDVAKIKRKTAFKTLVLDELSGFKSGGRRGSVRWKEARKIAVKCDHVWGLTGTPSPNGYLDLWGQIALLDNGERLGRTLTTYRSRYFYPGNQLPNGVITEWILRPESDKHIRELIEDICLSMSTDQVLSELPEAQLNKVAVELPPSVKQAYRKMAKDLVVNLKEIFGGEIHTAAGAGILTSKLAQITAGFLYVDDADIRGYQYTPLHKEKLKALEEIVEGTGSPVLVFYRFRAELEMIKETLGSRVHTINEPDVQARWNAGEFPVLVAHPASAGHGLNLQYGGHTIVWTSLDWDLELWLQANKRLARQGQKNNVIIHVLLANGSVDHLMLKRLDEKEDVQEELLEYLESPI